MGRLVIGLSLVLFSLVFIPTLVLWLSGYLSAEEISAILAMIFVIASMWFCVYILPIIKIDFTRHEILIKESKMLIHQYFMGSETLQCSELLDLEIMSIYHKRSNVERQEHDYKMEIYMCLARV